MKKFLNTKVKDAKAITLIALVITIVVLIILATVAIQLSLGNNGIFNRAKTAKEQYQNAEEYEGTQIGKTVNEIDNYVDGNRGQGQTSGQPYYIDTSRKLATIANDTDYDTQSAEYTATENCFVTGYICMTKGQININIDGVTIGNLWSRNANVITYPIYYCIKAGQTIKFEFLQDVNPTYSNGSSYKMLNVYAVQ